MLSEKNIFSCHANNGYVIEFFISQLHCVILIKMVRSLNYEIDGPRQSAVSQSEVPVQTARRRFPHNSDHGQTRDRLVLLVYID